MQNNPDICSVSGSSIGSAAGVFTRHVKTSILRESNGDSERDFWQNEIYIRERGWDPPLPISISEFIIRNRPEHRSRASLFDQLINNWSRADPIVSKYLMTSASQGWNINRIEIRTWASTKFASFSATRLQVNRMTDRGNFPDGTKDLENDFFFFAVAREDIRTFRAGNLCITGYSEIWKFENLTNF